MKQGSERHAPRGKISGKFCGHGVLFKSVVFGAFRDTFGGPLGDPLAGHPGFAFRLDEIEIGPSRPHVDPPYGFSKTPLFNTYGSLCIFYSEKGRSRFMKQKYSFLECVFVYTPGPLLVWEKGRLKSPHSWNMLIKVILHL